MNRPKLKNGDELLSSPIVANNLMNRGRGCLGANSYRKELGFDPVAFLDARLSAGRQTAWLDVACGEARALFEAARLLESFKQPNTGGESRSLRIVGIDLAGMFAEPDPISDSVELLETSVEEFSTPRKFDLVTCVHGLHYVGDKISAILRCVQWLKPDGLFLANLDLRSLQLAERENSAREFAAYFKANGFVLDRRRRLISLDGGRRIASPFVYLGADDAAGPNYTGQRAVDSYYRRASK